MPAASEHPAIAAFFAVTIDMFDLGDWTKCSGLEMTINYDPYPESGMNFFQHRFPKHLEYGKITLERPISPETGAVMAWISAFHMLPVPTGGVVKCLSQWGEEIMRWDMFGVTPLGWKGPSMDAGQSTAIATEQLTIAHSGFL